MWYSVKCTYWTDDWSKLKKFGPGIPCCPHCGVPGFQTNYQLWYEGAKTYSDDVPGYLEFLLANKEQCHGGKTFSELWAEHQKQK